MWQAALPMVMDYMDKRKAAEQSRKEQAAAVLQRSAAQLGAPSTAHVGAAGAVADDERAKRSQFSDLLMQLAGGQAPGAPVGDAGKTSRLLMQLAQQNYGGGGRRGGY
jgi:hypothetical protein